MKKNNYAYFAAIRADDLETVKAMTAASPEIVNIPAPKKPADTRGMSPLQAALCTGWHRDIAWFLLEHGADVNFCADARLDGYPVLFDAVNIAVWNARRYAWDGQDTTPVRLVWKHTQAEADDAFAFLQRVLALGADVRRTDQYGRGVLMEAMEETSRLCPVLNTETGEYYPSRPITEEMRSDIRRTFTLLIAAGADRENRSSYSGKTIRQHYENTPAWPLCADLFD